MWIEAQIIVLRSKDEIFACDRNRPRIEESEWRSPIRLEASMLLFPNDSLANF